MEGIRLSGERRSLRRVSAYPASFNESKPMRRTPRSLADVREELVQVQEEFTRLQKRIEAVWDCVTDLLVRFFGEQRPAFAGLKEEELIARYLPCLFGGNKRTLWRWSIPLRSQEATELQT
jgi:hypothetical protein